MNHGSTKCNSGTPQYGDAHVGRLYEMRLPKSYPLTTYHVQRTTYHPPNPSFHPAKKLFHP